MKVWVLEQCSPDLNWEVLEVYVSAEAAKADLDKGQDDKVIWEPGEAHRPGSMCGKLTVDGDISWFLSEWEVKS